MVLTRVIDKQTVKRTEYDVPMYIIELAAEATSEHSDGYVRERTKQKLIEIRDYIDNVLAESEVG
jgi:hypothetical protein